MPITHTNEDDHIRRNPQDESGKLRGGGGDLIGDEREQADNWRELIAEEEGRIDSDAMDDVGNAQSAMLGGTGDLDRTHRLNTPDDQATHNAAEDSPDLINPMARTNGDREASTTES